MNTRSLFIFFNSLFQLRDSNTPINCCWQCKICMRTFRSYNLIWLVITFNFHLRMDSLAYLFRVRLDDNKFWSRLFLQPVSLEGARACVGHSILVASSYVKTEQARIARLKLDLLAFATVGPLAVSARPATLFLVNDIEKVWSEDVWSSGTTSSLLVYARWIPPLVFHLHIVSNALLTLGNAVFLTLCLLLKGSRSIYWRNLSRIVHVNLVYSVVSFVGTVHLPEDKSSECHIADSFSGFMTSNSSLEGPVNLYTCKLQSELI